MSLPKLGNYRVIYSEGYEILHSVWNCMSEEAVSEIKTETYVFGKREVTLL
jgi:hypothetical protein